MPNFLASAALLLWVPISAVIFTVARPPMAATLVVLGALMFLPVGVEFDFPALPGFGKEDIAYLCALLGALFCCPSRLASARPGRGPELLVLVMIVGCFATVMTNGEVLRFGPRIVSSLHLWDALSIGWTFLFTYGLPFFLGRALFRDSRDLRVLLVCLGLAGLVYSLFILVEIRLSPHFHKWTYGFHQHKFSQTIRWGGFRPMVYMAHGLAVSLFMVAAVTAYSSLKHAGFSLFGNAIGRVVSPYMLVIVVLCKSMASIVYALFAVPFVALASARRQASVAAAICCFVLVFPVTRVYGLFPVDGLLSVARSVAADRAASLEYRFTHEVALLERAKEKMMFGWGSFGRNRIYSLETGRDISTTDSYWMIALGAFGVVGLGCAFGLLTQPVFATWYRLRKIRSGKARLLHSGLALIVSLFALDLLVNGLFSSLPYFLAGTLTGSLGGATRRTNARSGSRRGATAGAVPGTGALRTEPSAGLDPAAGGPANVSSLLGATRGRPTSPTAERGRSEPKDAGE